VKGNAFNAENAKDAKMRSKAAANPRTVGDRATAGYIVHVPPGFAPLGVLCAFAVSTTDFV
jgi:hypothetical protein